MQMQYDFRSQDNYGGFNPNESQASANQRGGYTNGYNGATSPYGNNSFYQLDKRTDALTMFNDGGVMFKCTLINDGLSIMVCPPSIDPATGKPKYPKENRVTTMLKPEKLSAMADMVDHVFLDKVEMGERYNFGVWSNNEHSTLVSLSTDSTGEGLTIFNGINNASGGVPTKVTRYDFKEEALVEENFDQLSGQGSPRVMKAQLALFFKMVNAALEVCTETAGHQFKNANRAETTKVENDLRVILERVGGVSPDPRGGMNPYSQQATTGYMESGSLNKADTLNTVMSPIPTELSSLEDLPF